MRISERGQVTIPQEIREQFGLLPNTEVEFVVTAGAVQLVPSAGTRRKAVEALYGSKRLARSTDELMALLRA
jgi:AbrB family looped-hinge helix DNA binding protein